MLTFIARRLLWMVPVMVLVTFFVYALLLLTPGDAAVTRLGEFATPAQLARARVDLGLDQPIPVQYGIWLRNTLQGNLGRSIASQQQVGKLVGDTLPVTVELAILATMLALIGAVPLAVLSATRRNSPLDWLVNGVSYLGVALPDFWLGILLILLVSLSLRWLPPSGFVPLTTSLPENLQLMLLPALTLAASRMAVLTRQFRSSLLEVLSAQYILTARAKGLAERTVTSRHAFQNAIIPVLTILGLQLGYLLGGAVVVEVIFALPGLGRLAVDAIFAKDFPVVQAVVLVIAAASLSVNLVVDVLYAYVNPRIRFS